MGGAFDKAKETVKDKASEYLDKDKKDEERSEQEAEARETEGAETEAAGGTVPPQSRREDEGEPGEEGWAHTEEGSGYRSKPEKGKGIS